MKLQSILAGLVINSILPTKSQPTKNTAVTWSPSVSTPTALLSNTTTPNPTRHLTKRHGQDGTVHKAGEIFQHTCRNKYMQDFEITDYKEAKKWCRDWWKTHMIEIDECVVPEWKQSGNKPEAEMDCVTRFRYKHYVCPVGGPSCEEDLQWCHGKRHKYCGTEEPWC